MMGSSLDTLEGVLKALGVERSAIIPVKEIQFNEDFRRQCEQNICGSYNKNWMCPPAVGSFAELKDKVLKFDQGLVFQTIYQLEDSFDFEGMQAGTEKHTKILRAALKTIQDNGVLKEYLPLNVGPCTFCARCSFLDDQECRFPEAALSSVEASGIDVTALVKSAGFAYNNGKDTMSCVSLVLFSDE